MNIEQVN